MANTVLIEETDSKVQSTQSAQRRLKTGKTVNTDKLSELKTTVIYYPELMSPPKSKLNSVSISALRGHRITIEPGMNQFSQAQMEFLNSTDIFDEYITVGAIVVKQPTEKLDNVDTPESLMGYSIKDALEIIEECSGKHLPELRQWLQQDRRAQIQNSLATKINRLSGG